MVIVNHARGISVLAQVMSMIIVVFRGLYRRIHRLSVEATVSSVNGVQPIDNTVGTVCGQRQQYLLKNCINAFFVRFAAVETALSPMQYNTTNPRVIRWPILPYRTLKLVGYTHVRERQSWFP